MRFTLRVHELAQLLWPLPFPREESASRCSSGGILPRKPSNNSSFVHTLGITKLKVVFGGEIVSRKVPTSCCLVTIVCAPPLFIIPSSPFSWPDPSHHILCWPVSVLLGWCLPPVPSTRSGGLFNSRIYSCCWNGKGSFLGK